MWEMIRWMNFPLWHLHRTDESPEIPEKAKQFYCNFSIFKPICLRQNRNDFSRQSLTWYYHNFERGFHWQKDVFGLWNWVLNVRETRKNWKKSQLDIQVPISSLIHVWFHSSMSQSKTLQLLRRKSLMNFSFRQLHQKPKCPKKTNSANNYCLFRNSDLVFLNKNLLKKTSVFSMIQLICRPVTQRTF